MGDVPALDALRHHVHVLLNRWVDRYDRPLCGDGFSILGVDRHVVHAHLVLARLGRGDVRVHWVAVEEDLTVARCVRFQPPAPDPSRRSDTNQAPLRGCPDASGTSIARLRARLRLRSPHRHQIHVADRTDPGLVLDHLGMHPAGPEFHPSPCPCPSPCPPAESADPQPPIDRTDTQGIDHQKQHHQRPQHPPTPSERHSRSAHFLFPVRLSEREIRIPNSEFRICSPVLLGPLGGLACARCQCRPQFDFRFPSLHLPAGLSPAVPQSPPRAARTPYRDRSGPVPRRSEPGAGPARHRAGRVRWQYRTHRRIRPIEVTGSPG